jgi:hypothetical protein
MACWAPHGRSFNHYRADKFHGYVLSGIYLVHRACCFPTLPEMQVNEDGVCGLIAVGAPRVAMGPDKPTSYPVWGRPLIWRKIIDIGFPS